MNKHRRNICFAALLVAAVLIPQPAQAADDWRSDRCRYARTDGEKGWTQREVVLTIECAVDHWQPVSGGLTKALDVARCESGLQAKTVSSNGMLGVYQFHPDTWRSATSSRRAFMRRWSISDGALNGRANVLIAARIYANTWSPWSCA